ncbi:MAG: hypothetical protein V4772_21535 [Pseudomonadota bacterium]
MDMYFAAVPALTAQCRASLSERKSMICQRIQAWRSGNQKLHTDAMGLFF